MDDGALGLVPLGTNGFIPTFGRQTMSFLLRVDERRAILLDAGTGVGRLLEPETARFLEGVDELVILLTHYHLDHVVGLSYLPAVWRDRAVRILGPAPPLVDGSPREALDRLIAPPLFPFGLEQLPLQLSVDAYSAPELELFGLPIRCRRQRHAGGSAGLVIGERLAYLTDCEMEEEAAAAFAGGATLLIHEMWVTDDEVARGARKHGHSTVEEVARLAERAGVGAVLPVHHLPTRSSAELDAVVTRLDSLTDATVLRPPEGTALTL